MWFVTLWNEGWPALGFGVVIAASAAASCTDLMSRRIPNWLTFPLAAAGAINALAVGGFAGLADAITAGALISAPFVLQFLLGRGGAGDAKLMMAIGLWLGTIAGLAVLAAVALCGCAIAIVTTIAQRRSAEVCTNVMVAAHQTMLAVSTAGAVRPCAAVGAGPAARFTMPYAPAILLGVIVTAIGVSSWRV